jgi:hypothetical protein
MKKEKKNMQGKLFSHLWQYHFDHHDAKQEPVRMQQQQLQQEEPATPVKLQQDDLSWNWMSPLEGDLGAMVDHVAMAIHNWKRSDTIPSSRPTAAIALVLVATCLVALSPVAFLVRKLARRKKNKKNKRAASPLSSVQQQEYESLIAALQDELHAKSVSENEQAILFRQEKKILQSRIQQLLHNTTTSTKEAKDEEEKKAESTDDNYNDDDDDNDNCTSAALHQQIAQLSKQLAQKQNEIDRLNNVLEEMQHAMDLQVQVQVQSGNNNTDSLDETCHEQIVQRLLSKIQLQPSLVQDQIEKELTKQRLSQSQTSLLQGQVQVQVLDQEDDDQVSLDDSASSVHSTEDLLSDASADDDDYDNDYNILINNNKIVLLLSTMPGNLQVSMHQTRLEAIFRHGLKLAPACLEVVDGCNADLHQLRNDLFRISGLHAIYPQVFLIVGGSDIQFVGDFHTVLELHDSRVLPERIGLELLEQHASSS